MLAAAEVEHIEMANSLGGARMVSNYRGSSPLPPIPPLNTCHTYTLHMDQTTFNNNAGTHLELGLSSASMVVTVVMASLQISAAEPAQVMHIVIWGV